jgi:hypothetical protein
MTNSVVGRLRLEDVFDVREVDVAGDVAAELFRRKFREEIPDFPHHVMGFWRSPEGEERPFCYTHFTPMGEILLCGGSCTDNRLLRKMPPAHRQLLKRAGGAYRMTLERAIGLFASRYPAIFGYCGDPLADRIDRSIGAVSTEHQHLLVVYTQVLDPETRARLIAQAHAVGPF